MLVTAYILIFRNIKSLISFLTAVLQAWFWHGHGCDFCKHIWVYKKLIIPKIRFKIYILLFNYRNCMLFRVFGLSGPRSPALISSSRSLAPGPHKSFNKLNLLLVKAQWLWSCAHYFQWFTVYLNHVDLMTPSVHVLKKPPHGLMCT